MMASRVDALVQAIKTALTAPAMTSVPVGDIYVDLVYAIDQTKTLALAIEEGIEPEPNLNGLIGRAERRVNVDVHVIAKGLAPFRGADPALVESYNRIMADRTLGGLALDIQEGPTERRRAPAEQSIGVITKTYIVEFRTSAHSLEN